MARYWVGGSGNWSDATNHWATTSGGAPGAGNLPTATDDVVFDTLSHTVGYTVTIDATTKLCQNLTFGAPLTGNVTWAGSVAMTISGSMTLYAGLVRTYTGGLTFNSTSTGNTITLAGKTMASTTTFNGAGGEWIVQDTWNNGTSGFTLTSGTLDTNGKTITIGGFISSGVLTRVLTLGASVVNSSLSGWTIPSTGLTINAGTSSIRISSSSSTYTFGTHTFNDLRFAGTSLTSRILVQSGVIGTASTITAASVTLSNTDFLDIVGAGAASWTGTSLGNAGGNSGITFTTPVTRYAVAAGNWSATATWSASSGGASGASVPICHDTVFLNASSGAGTITINTTRAAASVTCTGYTGTLTIGVSTTVYGDFTLVSGMTFTHSFALTLSGRGTHTLTLATKTFAQTTTFAGYGGSYTLQDTYVNTSGLTIGAGTFNTNNQAITCSSLSSGPTNSPTRAINLGSSLVTCTGNVNPWSVSATGLTLNTGTSTIKLNEATAANKNFVGGSQTYYNVWFTGAGSGSFTVTGSNTFFNLKDDGSVAHSLKFTAGTTQNFLRSDSFNVNGTAGNLISIDSTTTANHTLTMPYGGVVSCDYLNIQHSVALPSPTWYAGTHSTDNQAVSTAGSGWFFTAPPTAPSPVIQHHVQQVAGLM